MHIHSAQDQTIKEQVERSMAQTAKAKDSKPFLDPIREFSMASHYAGTVRNWLTYPIEERKRLVKSGFRFIARGKGDKSVGVAPETEESFERRQLERWRALCVVIQEESRAQPPNRSVEVAIGALKQLFYDVDWEAKPLADPPPAA